MLYSNQNIRYSAAILCTRVIVFLLSFFCCYCATAQSVPYKLYSIHDGIPQSQILNIIQDSRGYIWVGTQDGLAYFDGIKFVNITHHKNLSNNYIHCIAEDQNKQIVINIGKWLVKYNGQKFKIDTLHSLMLDHSFVIDQKNRMWACNMENKIFFSDDWIHWKLFETTSAYKNVRFTRIIYDYQHDRMILKDEKNSLFEIKNSRLTKIADYMFIGNVCTRNSELVYFRNDSIFEQSNNKFRFVVSTNKRLINSVVKSGKKYYYVSRFDSYLRSITMNGAVDSSYVDCALNYLFLDKNSNLWASTELGLVQFFDNGFSNFPKSQLNAIWSMTEDKNHNILFGSLYKPDSLWVLKNKRIQSLRTFSPVSSASSNKFGEFYFGGARDKEGNAYFPMNWGIMKYDGQKFTTVDLGEGFQKHPLIIYLTNTSDQEKLIACTNGGLIIHNIKNNSNRYIKGTNEKPLIGFVLGASSDRSNNVWLTTKYGIYRFNQTTDSIDIYFSKKKKNFKFNTIVTIHCDIYDNVWAGSDQGLLLFDKTDYTFKIFKAGIIDRKINSITSIKDKYLVIGAMDGVYLLDLKLFQESKRIVLKKYNQHNGFLGKEPNQNAIYVDHSDNVWVASSDIVTKINPEEINLEIVPPNLFVTEVNNIRIPYANYGKAFRLESDLNYAKIKFEAVGFDRPFSNEFSWKLDNGQWSQWLSEDYAYLDDITSGTHTFYLRSRPIGNPDELTMAETSIKIIANLPFYREKRFPIVVAICISILSFCVGFIIYTILKKNHNRKRDLEILNQNKLIEENERNRQINYLQIQTLQAQLNPHFIFNVLDVVHAKIKENSRETASQLIVDLSKLIRQFLESSISMDFNRIYHSDITLRAEIGLLESYIKFEQLQYPEKFEYSIVYSDDIDIDNTYIPPMLIQPYLENAIKHGFLLSNHSKGFLQVDFSKSNQATLICKIIDNGIGIKKAKELQENFIKVHKSRGTTIVEQRIQVMQEMGFGIQLSTLDNPTGGTIIIIEIDL